MVLHGATISNCSLRENITQSEKKYVLGMIVRALAALLEDLGLVPVTHMVT